MNLTKALRMGTWFGGILSAVLAFGCTNLPDLALDTCGNYVIDPGEDCDLLASSDYTCARPTEVNECHFTCNPATPKCPDGFGCGREGVCRRASGSFTFAWNSEAFVWPTILQAGDFDADGNGDLLLLGTPDSFGDRPARALFSEGFSLRSGLNILPTAIANPMVGRGATDEFARDIAFASYDGVALLRGYDDRSADFTVFPSVSTPEGTHVRFAMTDVLPTHPGDEVVILHESMDGTAELYGTTFAQPPTSLVSVPGGEEKLLHSDTFFPAKFNETIPCSQVVLGYRDATSIDVFTTCRNVGGGFDWNVGGTLLAVSLQPAAPLDRGVMANDIDLDGHLDLVIGADGRTYVAYGLGDGQFISQKPNGIPNVAAPYTLPLIAGGAEGFPLAIGDLNADSRPDFVMETEIVLSKGADYEVAYKNIGAPWSEALIANLNANNWPDVVAIVDGALDIHFFNNAGNGIFGSATLPTEGHPQHLRRGDFDGDFLEDIVFSEGIAEDGKIVDHLSFAFGSPFGPPSAPVATGEVGTLGSIITGNIVGATGPDPMTEIGVVVEGDGGTRDSIALLPGRASRAIFSTLPLRNGPVPHLPVSLAFGRFGDDTPDIVALGANAMDGRLSLFRIEAFDEEGLSVPNSSDLLPANFIPAEISNTINLRYGATVIAADFENDGHDEALVVGAYADRQHGAFAIADYDTTNQKFKIIDAQVFAGEVTSDSRMFAEDIDGDGIQDIVLTTGTLASPSELLIAWGVLGGLPNLNESLAHIRLEELGVRAVAALRTPQGKGKMLLASTSNGTYLLSFQADRSYSTELISDMGPGRAFAVIDFDRDGVEDLALQTDEGLKLFRSVPK